MGSAPSIINKQFPQFTSSNQLTIDDVNNCDRTWNIILSDQTLSPDYSPSSSDSNSNSSPDSSCNSELSPIQSQEISSNLNNLKSTSISLTISKINNNNNNKKQFYRLWFYKLCYQSLKSKFEEDKKINGVVMTSHNDPNALHTIVIFMLKLVSIYITSLKAKKAFEKYAKSLSLSSAHLGIRVKDYHLFQNAFLETIQTCFQSEPHVVLSWKKLFGTILRIVLPECVHQESTTSIKRQLRLSGNSNLRDSPENDVITYYAEYAFKLISTMSNDENDLNSVNSRLSTSLHNSIENEYDNSDLNRIEIHNKITMVT